MSWYVRDAQGNLMSLYSLPGNGIRLREQYVFGSSRLGVINKDVPLTNTLAITSQTLPSVGDTYSHTLLRGEKQYELSNHLGNVLATVSDKKWGVAASGSSSLIDHYTGDLTSAQDYYPFGMTMPGRSGYKTWGGWSAGNSTVNGQSVAKSLSIGNRTNNTPPEYRATEVIEFTAGFQSGVDDGFEAYIATVENTPPGGEGGSAGDGGAGRYRYGFNGKENDNEVKGEGNQIDYDKRIYDPRVGRFYSIDPLQAKFPFYAPYQFAGNTPIQAIDLDGAEEYHYTMTMNKQGKAVLHLVDKKEVNHHIVFGIKWWPDTKIEVKRYKVDYDGKSYHIGFAKYGTGYGNADKREDFENNYIKKQGDAIAFEQTYIDDNHSRAASDVDIVVKTQLFSGEVSVPMGESISINPRRIRFSQGTVSGLKEIEASMKKNGWKGEPIDIVKMNDGLYTSVDNTRLMAAQNVDINVKANVHAFNEPISSEMAVRFADKKGDLPKTWGEAINNRVSNQNASFRKQGENGTFTQPKASN